MSLNRERVRDYLKQGNFQSLFIEELGWDKASQTLPIPLDGETVLLKGVARKRDLVAFVCRVAGALPPRPARLAIEREVAKRFHEHLILFVSDAQGEQIWQWTRREPGQPLRTREFRYDPRQLGEALIQKLEAIQFGLDEEEGLTLLDVTSRVRAAFDVERATKRFFEQFKKERDAFQKFLEGIPNTEMARWYASVMLNRIMFIYFIQKKGFLDNNADYLRDKLKVSQGEDRFYPEFLCPLFFEGFAKPEGGRSPAVQQRLGKVPYLNGGIFEQHQIEQAHGETIRIPDRAFGRLFDFFDKYQWHLDDRPLRKDNEINPDVLGYIFEKYINQKQMGAYYTKEDITEYISQNTILPFLFDEARKGCRVAFEGSHTIWDRLSADPDRYLYEPLRHGATLPLPPEIAAGLDEVAQRGPWNTPTAPGYGLPTEIWRETVERRRRYETVRAKLAAGELRSINDFITYNLDIRQFAQDVIEQSEGPELLRAFWKALQAVTVLDPTCGSGAFLFAALTILQPLYEGCLERMQGFVNELGPDAPAAKYSDFRETLAEVAKHPSQDYFVLKSIVVRNLYGVDIMPEAVEIAKLRLFLKLVAQVERVEQVEPLPDIDFNIRVGNTLVGFATRDEVQRALTAEQVASGVQQSKMLVLHEDEDAMKRIEEKAADADRLFTLFRTMQEQYQMDAAAFSATKRALRQRLGELAEELNRYLAREYGVNPDHAADFQRWLASHQPFHWFVEFYGTLKHGGFDVVIGNPPYVEYHKVKSSYQLKFYNTLSCGNLYAYVLEKSYQIGARGRAGFIVPLSLVCTQRMEPLRQIISDKPSWTACFDMRPNSLFEGISQRLCIILTDREMRVNAVIYTGGYRRWSSTERPNLLPLTTYVSQPTQKSNVIPKLSSALELSVLHKAGSGSSLEGFTSKNNTPIYVHRIVRYFAKAIDFIPLYVDAKGSKAKSDDYKPFHFDTKQQSNILCLLNSSLFYWFWRCHSDGFHCGYGDVYLFRYNTYPQPIGSTLEKMRLNLMRHVQENASEKIISTQRGSIKYQEFSMKSSKPIIDKIDRVLAQHYGFTDEELDFILNYDIKYRMGDALNDDEDAAEDED